MYYSQYFTQSFDLSQTDNSRDLILALFNACLTTSSRHFESGPQKSPEGIAWVITQYDLIVHGSLSALEECQVATKVIDMNRFLLQGSSTLPVSRKRSLTYMPNLPLSIISPARCSGW